MIKYYVVKTISAENKIADGPNVFHCQFGTASCDDNVEIWLAINMGVTSRCTRTIITFSSLHATPQERIIGWARKAVPYADTLPYAKAINQVTSISDNIAHGISLLGMLISDTETNDTTIMTAWFEFGPVVAEFQQTHYDGVIFGQFRFKETKLHIILSDYSNCSHFYSMIIIYGNTRIYQITSQWVMHNSDVGTT